MRIEKVSEILKKLNLDAVYLTDKYNLRYITGFTGTTGYGLITQSKAYFFTDFRYIEQANNQVVQNGFQVVNMGKKYTETLGEVLRNSHIGKCGIEDTSMTLSEYKKISNDFQSIEFLGIGKELSDLRQIKDEQEIALIEKAADIADRVFAKILPEIKAGVTEKMIAAKIEYFMKCEGAEDKSFETIVASGWRSAMPHGVASDKAIGNNEFVKLDFGCYFNGYTSDITRTIFFGDAITSQHIDIYNTVLEAQLIGIDEVREGVTGAYVDGKVREYITSKGYGENFGHGLGHGIGLEIHEEPSLSPRGVERALESGMTVTCEPGIYVEGFGGVRIEDDLVVTKDGCRVLTKSPKQLIIIKP